MSDPTLVPDPAAVALLGPAVGADVPVEELFFANAQLAMSSLPRLNLRCSGGSGADLRGTDLTEGRFLECGFAAADFRWAVLEFVWASDTSFAEAKFDEVEAAGLELVSCDLRASSWARAQLARARFRWDPTDNFLHVDRADFTGADFTNATLTGGRFEGASFKDVTFVDATLVDCDFRGAVVDGACFDGATLRNVRFDPGCGPPTA
jgi:uncharacterized protein YjbI with pentapeptide repeats